MLFFAHGFEGSPKGPKPAYLRDKGHALYAPQMNAGGLGFEEQVAVVIDALASEPRIHTLIGSSMGGLACAVAAERLHHAGKRPDLSLILLAPAINVHQTFARRLGAEAMKAWQAHGTLPYPHEGFGETVPLPWRLYEECEAAASVVIHHPCAIIHGKTDDVVDPRAVLELALRSPGVTRMQLVDDDHRLLKSLPLVDEILRDKTID